MTYSRDPEEVAVYLKFPAQIFLFVLSEPPAVKTIGAAVVVAGVENWISALATALRNMATKMR